MKGSVEEMVISHGFIILLSRKKKILGRASFKREHSDSFLRSGERKCERCLSDVNKLRVKCLRMRSTDASQSTRVKILSLTSQKWFEAMVQNQL